MKALLIAAVMPMLLAHAVAVSAVDASVGVRSAESKYIALTFDDGPDEEATPALLDVLKAHGAKATFFVHGSRIEAHRTILQRIVREGHSVGNHTLTHPRLTGLDEAEIHSEISSVQILLRGILGSSPQLFRPPYGALDETVSEATRTEGLAIVLWSIYPDDSSYFATATSISEHIYSRATDGDIIFLHDTSMRSVEAVEVVLRELSAKGFIFVTAEQLIARRGELNPGATYRAGYEADPNVPSLP